MKPMHASIDACCRALSTCFVAASALGQALNYTSVEAIAGKPVQLTYHADAHKSTCTPAPIPTFRVIEPPKNGVLSVRKAVLSTDKFPAVPDSRRRLWWCSINRKKITAAPTMSVTR